MKKIYEAPSMEVTKISVADVILASATPDEGFLSFDISGLWNE